MPYNFENTAGYLGIRLANQQRKQALQDELERAPVNVGGPELAVAQDAVGDSRKQRDMAFQRDTALGVADRNQQAIFNRLQFRQDSPEVQARIANIESQIADRGVRQGQGAARVGQGAQRLQLEQLKAQFKAQIDAARTHSDRQKAYAAAVTAGIDPAEFDSVAPPVTVAPGQFNVPQGSGPAPAATHADPNLTPSAQPSAPDAAQNPATAAPPPAVGGYNPAVVPLPPPDPNHGARLSKVGLDKVRESNRVAQELAPLFSRAVKAIEATKDSDYNAGSVGSTVRSAGSMLAPNLTGFAMSAGENLGLRDKETIARQQEAESAVTELRSRFNQSISGLTVTEQEDMRLKQAFAMVGNSVLNGNRQKQLDAIKSIEQIRAEIYTRNDQIAKTGYLPKDFKYLNQGADWVEGGAPPPPAPAPQQAPQTQGRREPPPKTISAEEAMNTPVGPKVDPQKKAEVIALMRKYKLFGKEGQAEATARWLSGERATGGQ